ncbi:hypothetical protein M8J77_026057 [Diaphorina citri]|nr:hypothetical protein M8J77_026057 [Diaphorina citri]
MDEHNSSSQKEILSEAEKEKVNVRYGFRSACSQFTASVAQNFLLFSLGMAFGMPTVVVGVLDHKVASNQTILESPDLILSDEQSSWLGSILFLFHPFGSIISGYFLEYIGRKRLMILVGFPFFLGWILLYLAETVSIIMLGTVCMGLSVGCCEAPIISYIGEISEPRMRGSLSLFAGAACNFGVFIIFLIYALTDWRTTVLISAIFPILTMIMIAFIPESPTWLVSKGRLEEAERSLRWVRGWSKKHKVRVEFEQLVKDTNSATLYVADSEYTTDQRKSSQLSKLLNYLVRPEIVRPFIMIMILFFITIIASLQPMRPFLVEIFRTFGLPMKSEWVLVLTGILSITGSFVSTITVNKLGKRASCPCAAVLGNGRPDVSLLDELHRGVDAWVGQLVDRVEGCPSEGPCDEGSRRACRDVTVDADIRLGHLEEFEMKAGVGALEWNLEFLICLLGGCQGLVVESCVDGINSGECVSDDILAAWDVLNVSGELGDEVQMPELPWGTFLGLLEE